MDRGLVVLENAIKMLARDGEMEISGVVDYLMNQVPEVANHEFNVSFQRAEIQQILEQGQEDRLFSIEEDQIQLGSQGRMMVLKETFSMPKSLHGPGSTSMAAIFEDAYDFFSEKLGHDRDSFRVERATKHDCGLSEYGINLHQQNQFNFHMSNGIVGFIVAGYCIGDLEEYLDHVQVQGGWGNEDREWPGVAMSGQWIASDPLFSINSVTIHPIVRTQNTKMVFYRTFPIIFKVYRKY